MLLEESLLSCFLSCTCTFHMLFEGIQLFLGWVWERERLVSIVARRERPIWEPHSTVTRSLCAGITGARRASRRQGQQLPVTPPCREFSHRGHAIPSWWAIQGFASFVVTCGRQCHAKEKQREMLAGLWGSRLGYWGGRGPCYYSDPQLPLWCLVERLRRWRRGPAE